jgi:hemerythrin
MHTTGQVEWNKRIRPGNQDSDDQHFPLRKLRNRQEIIIAQAIIKKHTEINEVKPKN